MAIRGELSAAGTVSVGLGCRVWVTVAVQGGDQLKHLPTALDLRNERWAGSIPAAVRGSTIWPRGQRVTFHFIVNPDHGLNDGVRRDEGLGEVV